MNNREFLEAHGRDPVIESDDNGGALQTPTPIHIDSDTLSFTAFQNAMVQQAKSFGYGMERLQTEINTLYERIYVLEQYKREGK
jgi:hypothetical protein